MRPEDFTLNTDYLATSTAFTTTKDFTFAGGTVGALDHQSQTLDLAVPKATQAAFQYMISVDGTNWYPSGAYNFNYNSALTAAIRFSRVGPTTLRAYLLVGNTSGSSSSYGQKQFWVKESAVIAPDAF